MGASDNHMNPRRARRELRREMGFDKHSQQPQRELSPEGTQGPAQQKPLSDIAKAFSRGKKPADR